MLNVTSILVVLTIALSTGPLFAQEPTSRPAARPIVLGPEDKSVFAQPPKGFDLPREGVAQGALAMVEYDSRTVGNKRKMLVYTPPGYSPQKKYPLLVLLHGIGGDENEWRKYCAPGIILDNLYADGKIPAMIVAFPNGRAQPNDRAEGDIFKHVKAFETFTGDLMNDVLPYLEAHYPLLPGRENRALAGFSMGGGQTLNIGLTHLETFAWLGGFSCAPNTKPIKELVPDPAALAKLNVLYLACGDQDGLISIGQSWHAFLKEKKVSHIWQVNPGGHNGETWKLDLYHFSKVIFRDDTP